MVWKPYAISLAIGVLFGGLYALLNIHSPAPPIIALLGILGVLAGESLMSCAKPLMTLRDVVVPCLDGKDFATAPTKRKERQA